MMDPVPPLRSLEEVKTLDQGPAPLYVLLLPEVSNPSSGVILPEVQVLAIPILSRQDGLLLAIPSDSFPPEVIYPAEPPLPRALIGPAKEVFVQAASDDDAGLERPLDYQIACLLVDFTAVLPRLRGLDPVTEGPGIHCFSEGAMEIYPSSSELLTAAYTWFQEEQEGRVAFYSAAEDLPLQQAPTVAKATQAKAKQKQLLFLLAICSQLWGGLSLTQLGKSDRPLNWPPAHCSLTCPAKAPNSNMTQPALQQRQTHD